MWQIHKLAEIPLILIKSVNTIRTEQINAHP